MCDPKLLAWDPSTLCDDRRPRGRKAADAPDVVAPSKDSGEVASLRRQIDMSLVSQLNQHQYLGRSLDRLCSGYERDGWYARERFNELVEEIRTLRGQVVFNASTANNNIDNVQDAFDAVRSEIQDKRDEVLNRFDVEIPELMPKVEKIETRAAQLWTVVASCLATSRSLSARVQRLEEASERHVELARAILHEVHEIASVGDEVVQHLVQRPRATLLSTQRPPKM